MGFLIFVSKEERFSACALSALVRSQRTDENCDALVKIAMGAGALVQIGLRASNNQIALRANGAGESAARAKQAT